MPNIAKESANCASEDRKIKFRKHKTAHRRLATWKNNWIIEFFDRPEKKTKEKHNRDTTKEGSGSGTKSMSR